VIGRRTRVAEQAVRATAADPQPGNHAGSLFGVPADRGMVDAADADRCLPSSWTMWTVPWPRSMHWLQFSTADPERAPRRPDHNLEEHRMNPDRMFDLARELAVAKSRRDIPAALRLLQPDMLLETPAFGTTARGLAENERILARFFATFPDYEVELDGHAANRDTLVCWGTARMTMTGERLGVSPSGRRAILPVFIRFTFADDRIASERFFFDLATLCAQSGVSTDGVRRHLFADAEPSGTGRAAA
jgi:predicted ester cyclase